MKPANFAPVYACIYPQLAELTRQHGYALAIHGSLGRDFDLICIPWIDNPESPEFVVKQITESFAIQQVGEPEAKKHGRIAYTISLSFGECALDLSFMPKLKESEGDGSDE
ncbi:hypothetical protein [Pseudomonas pseudonitroreducens]|uniref:hypothetical protein n=1 Tax=Pseudomonas pseudonitroreducens TaxID=2892326 RepID=UPI001F4406E4|nr:hypothetical protein [Pseudomonas pseudonitroreducens]